MVTGFPAPAFMRSCMMVRSFFFGLARNVISFWLTNLDSTNAAIKRAKRAITFRPLFSPTMTHIPFGVKARLHADNEWFPIQSKKQVVLLPEFDEILLGVIDDAISADGSNPPHIFRTAYAGNLHSERLGDLHGEGAHASRRSVNQDLLSRLNVSLVAQAA